MLPSLEYRCSNLVDKVEQQDIGRMDKEDGLSSSLDDLATTLEEVSECEKVTRTRPRSSNPPYVTAKAIERS